MAVKAMLLTFFASPLLARASGSDGFLAQGAAVDESADLASVGVVMAELEQAGRPQAAVEASNVDADRAKSVDEGSLPESVDLASVGVVISELEQAGRPQNAVEASTFDVDPSKSVDEGSLPEVGEVSAEEGNQEIPDSLVAFLEGLPLPTEATGNDAMENVEMSGASVANCDTRRLKLLIKKVGYKLWHDCADPNPEICHRIDSALKDYMRKGGERAAKKNICRHQGDFKNAYEHNYDKCKKLADKAGKKGLHLPSSPKDLKRMCR
jgi:hypothetical protein